MLRSQAIGFSGFYKMSYLLQTQILVCLEWVQLLDFVIDYAIYISRRDKHSLYERWQQSCLNPLACMLYSSRCASSNTCQCQDRLLCMLLDIAGQTVGSDTWF
jgi:hypothetical protein